MSDVTSQQAKRAAAKTTTKAGTPGPARKAAGPAKTGLTPSPALAAVIGSAAVTRPEVIKKLWDYIKAQQLQDATNRRAINADAKLMPGFGKPQITMFELAGLIGAHLG